MTLHHLYQSAVITMMLKNKTAQHSVAFTPAFMLMLMIYGFSAVWLI